MSTRISNQQSVMRKELWQARSRATVETILQAGARILSDEGWAVFTTNRVADLAGVSIGSLYQYFPDKLSLVNAIRRHFDDCLVGMQKSKAAGLSPVQFLANLVRAVIAAHSIYPGLNRVLLDEAPSSDNYTPTANLNRISWILCRGGSCLSKPPALHDRSNRHADHFRCD